MLCPLNPCGELDGANRLERMSRTAGLDQGVAAAPMPELSQARQPLEVLGTARHPAADGRLSN